MTDWKEKTLAHWDLINRLASRRFANPAVAEEAALAVMEGLMADNWARLAGATGLASFPAFLATLTCRLLEDFSRSRYGRLRPPGWLRQLGGVWIDLFRLLCLERLPLADAVLVAADRRADYDRRTIEHAAYTIRSEVVDCGRHQGLEVPLADDDLAAAELNEEGGPARPEHRLQDDERRRLFSALYASLIGQEIDIADSDMAVLLRLRFDLQDEERLLLKLCFQDGLNVAAAGKILGFNRFQIHGRLRRLLARIREEFERAGLGEELLALLKP